jgi:4'-phosphopantetheinyl transferase
MSDDSPNVDLHAFSLEFDSNSLKDLLRPDEISRAAAFHFERDRTRWIVARAGLRTLLARHASQSPQSLVFKRQAGGKPYLADSPLHFNISHSGNLALVVISNNGPVGVDLEPFDRGIELETCMQGFCSRFEHSRLDAIRSPGMKCQELIRTWCAKEAFLKALGTGLATPPQDLTVQWNNDGTAGMDGKSGFQIHFPAGLSHLGYCASVALPSSMTCPDVAWLDLEK